ncbi:MAG: leucine-rich repeat domain-containing protein [Saprospiraceae bacterium]|nr:leucine-rich repeat domain-containing protein [Saprospiraceae bacterium]
MIKYRNLLISFFALLFFSFISNDKVYEDLESALNNKKKVRILQLNTCNAYDSLRYDSIVFLKSLKELSISECARINRLPENLDKLNLEKFDFFWNGMGYEVIDYSPIGYIDKLIDLSLGPYGQISELPESFKNLKNLEILDLHNTRIRNLPYWISELKNLKVLDLSQCRMDSLPVQGLNKIKNLEVVKIYSTRFYENKDYVEYLEKTLKCKILY